MLKVRCRFVPSKISITAFLALTFAIVGYAQQPTLEDPLLNHLVGHWTLTGTIRGQQTTHDVDASWVLNHQYIQLQEVSREKQSGTSAPQYEALVLVGLDARRGEYVVHWMDVYGGGFSLVGYAARHPTEIPMVFKDQDGQFLTTLTYDAATDQWAWQMDTEHGATRQEFARLAMRRAKPR